MLMFGCARGVRLSWAAQLRHVYFSLKDAGAKIDAVVWKGVFGRLKFKPEEGLEVIATGKLSTFPGSSKYQIIIEQLEPSALAL